MKEPITGVLFDIGCVGVTEGDDSLTAYFPEDVSTKDITEALSSFEGVSAAYRAVEEQDWYAPWKEKFKPFSVAGLLICPPWRRDDCVPGDDEKLLILDPGHAFGTGDHATTMTVLRALRSWAGEQTDLVGKKFLDLGTGTGILAVAACLYGTTDVTAVDIEQAAIETAAENFALNGVKDTIRLIKGSIRDAGLGYDLIAANIFQEALVGLMPDMAAALKGGGRLIVSGLVAGQEPAVVEAAGEAGLTLSETVNTGGWVTALFRS